MDALCPKEISSMQLPPEHVDPNIVQTRTPEADRRLMTIFKSLPFQDRTNGKKKYCIVHHPQEKKLSSATKSVQKSPDKRPQLQCQGLRSPHAKTILAKKKNAKQNANTAKKTHARRPMECQKTNITNSSPSSSRTNEPMISCEEFEAFQQCVVKKLKTTHSYFIYSITN